MNLERSHPASPADELTLERGSLADYAALAEHHYRSARPATATRVLVLRHRRPTAVDRYLGRSASTQTAAVLVESLPALSCKLRNWALRDRYGTWLSPRQRAMLLNAEVRCISRVVVEPRWRGLGLAVRLVKAALAEPATRYTEALAAMGHVNPFFERAGMTAYRRPRHAFDERLMAALGRVGLSPIDLALLDATRQRLDALPPTDRQWLLRELRRWHGSRKARCRAPHPRRGWAFEDEDDPRELLRAARKQLLLEPIYYLKVNA